MYVHSHRWLRRYESMFDNYLRFCTVYRRTKKIIKLVSYELLELIQFAGPMIKIRDDH